MAKQSRIDAAIRPLAIVCMALCGVGSAASLFVILVRLPALAGTKLDLLLGTLQGAAVGLLFGIVALLVNLTTMVRRASRPALGDGRIGMGPGPSA